MEKSRKRISAVLSLLVAFSLTACSTPQESEHNVSLDGEVIVLSGDSATFNGNPVEEYDYTWHCDPSVSHNEVDNAPAEYYTGTKPETDAAVYIDHELYYYPELPESGFKLVKYDGENEWAYYYNDGENDEFIFSTLPDLSGKLPTSMMHSEADAAQNKVLHITRAGDYILEGEWHGQVLVDLGDEDTTFTDENAKVRIFLNGAVIECTAAPGIVFRSAYECDNTWEDEPSHSENVSLDNVGVTVVVVDGTDNTVTGTNVFRMLKTKYKDESSDGDVQLQKKMRKLDGAFYSYVSMMITGGAENTGLLTVNSGFEGIDSELHLSLAGGNIVVNSQDDGINVNEDNVSVVSFDGAAVTLNAAKGAEGDGVDSNGYVVIDGGSIIVNGVVPPDSAIDSEDGITYRSGTVIIDGVEQKYSPGDVFRETGMSGAPNGMGQPGRQPDGNGEFPGGAPGADFDIKDFKSKVAQLGDDATVDDVLRLLGMGDNRGTPVPPESRP